MMDAREVSDRAFAHGIQQRMLDQQRTDLKARLSYRRERVKDEHLMIESIKLSLRNLREKIRNKARRIASLQEDEENFACKINEFDVHHLSHRKGVEVLKRELVLEQERFRSISLGFENARDRIDSRTRSRRLDRSMMQICQLKNEITTSKLRAETDKTSGQLLRSYCACICLEMLALRESISHLIEQIRSRERLIEEVMYRICLNEFEILIAETALAHVESRSRVFQSEFRFLIRSARSLSERSESEGFNHKKRKTC